MDLDSRALWSGAPAGTLAEDDSPHTMEAFYSRSILEGSDWITVRQSLPLRLLAGSDCSLTTLGVKPPI